MKAQLRRVWQSRAPRERAFLAVLAALVAIIAYLLLAVSAGRAIGPLQASVTTLRAASARLERQALEFGHLRTAPPVSASATELRALVQQGVDRAGLSSSLLRIEAPDADQVVVVFGAVAFADWLKLIAGLQGQQVRLEACRIEALSAPGLVSVTATLVRAAPR